MKRDFDVVVVGGAMAGAGTAALLAAMPATSQLRVALVEPRPATPPAPGAPLDLRVSALSRASQVLLERAGAWPAVAARAAAYQRMVVWEARQDPTGPDALVFDAAELGEPDLGHIGENRSIQAALTERAEAAGDDPGETRALRRYERWRKAEALPAIALLDGIKRLFSGGNPFRSRLRQGALGLAQSSGTVKRLLMQRALGVAGELPAAARRAPS